MANGKIRSSSHVAGEKAISIVKEILPDEWVVREINPDYGLDLDIELFDSYSDGFITLGEHLYVQVKGTESPIYKTFEFNRFRTRVLKFKLETAELNLVERMGSAVPVLLIVVDIQSKAIYQICLNDYIKKILLVQNPLYKKQNTITINIPTSNILSKNKIDVLRWYGKRTKFYSIFHEMLVDIDDMYRIYDLKEFLALGKRFVKHYIGYDIWCCSDSWIFLKMIKDLLDELVNNNFISKRSSLYVAKIVLADKSEWGGKYIYEGFDFSSGIPAFLFAQKKSLYELFELIQNCSGYFETYCRQWFMPCLPLGIHD